MFRQFLPVLIFFASVLTGSAQVSFRAGGLTVQIDSTGRISGLTDPRAGSSYLPGQADRPLLQVKSGERWERPAQAAWRSEDSTLTLKYPSGSITVIRLTEKRTHLVLEVISASPEGRIDALQWGPVPVAISASVGEIIGVARDADFAIGLQVLNTKTLGGPLQNDEGSDPSRSSTAKAAPFGCTLQAYSLDRSRPRRVTGWWGQFPDMHVNPIPGETVVHSKIALFGCPANEALRTIGEIEIAEGLPHPMIDGTWAKESPEYGRSYLIADYDESTIDELLAYTKRAGLMTLYHMYPWESWGHFELSKKAFPGGTAGFRNCVNKAKRLGIRLGAHTLSDFINTNDPYVTPVPDKRLALTGTTSLARNAEAEDTVLYIEEPGYFANEKANWLHTVRIGDELIQYRSVSSMPPWTLNGCKRGAFGTTVSAHRKGEEAGKLLDHPYNVFFPDFELLQEIAANMARRFNELGLEQMDFDGFEGCLSAGQGDYGLEVFAKTFYDHLDHTVINGPSISEPYYWHICNYCNWGEPWYGGFTESMQQYRIDNQGLFERNYLPHMLGWYLLTDSTTLEEMEWMLARAAGYDAGFAMATSLEALRKNPVAGELLDAIRNWEQCRMAGAFPETLLGALKDPKQAFHLEKQNDRTFYLYPLAVIPGSDPPKHSRGEPFMVNLN